MKFRNKRIIIAGNKFDSILEYDVWKMLTLLPNVTVTKLQPRIYLTESKILYKPDFQCGGRSGTFYVEAKGCETATWRLKRRLWEHYGPAELHVYVRKGIRIVLKEIIHPIGNDRNRLDA